jgi:hypothetical protein
MTIKINHKCAFMDHGWGMDCLFVVVTDSRFYHTSFLSEHVLRLVPLKTWEGTDEVVPERRISRAIP